MSYEVGKQYNVLCLQLNVVLDKQTPSGGSYILRDYQGFNGWLPLLHEFQVDEGFIPNSFNTSSGAFKGHHAHINWQFVPEDLYRSELRRLGSPNRLETSSICMDADILPYLTLIPRLMVCLRPAIVPWQVRLRDRYCGQAIMNGRCPHKGTPVEAMYEEVGGVLVCPAHGLRFDKATGRVLDVDVQTRSDRDDRVAAGDRTRLL